MKKIFVTGSTTGLGLLAGKLLKEQGHEVILHARTLDSAKAAQASLDQKVSFVIGDVSELSSMKSVAEQAMAFGPFDSVIHNVGIYERHADVMTKDGLRTMFAVNVLTPYVLSALISSKRMVFLSSGMHRSGKAELDDPQWLQRPWNETKAYCDSKLFDLMLAKYLARKRPNAFFNAVDPGWVPTRMGGANAPGDLIEGATTQVWLSVSEDPEALVSGNYFHHKQLSESNPLADSEENQEQLISYLEKISGIKI